MGTPQPTRLGKRHYPKCGAVGKDYMIRKANTRRKKGGKVQGVGHLQDDRVLFPHLALPQWNLFDAWHAGPTRPGRIANTCDYPIVVGQRFDGVCLPAGGSK